MLILILSDVEVTELLHSLVDDTETIQDDYCSDASSQSSAIKICRLLKGEYVHILESILIKLLCSKRSQIWETYSAHDFYDNVMASCHSIYNSMTTHEIDLVISTISEYAVSGCPLEISSKATKIVKANKLGMCLGHSDIVKPKIKRKSTMRLMDMASAVIRQDVPVDVLRACSSGIPCYMGFSNST